MNTAGEPLADSGRGALRIMTLQAHILEQQADQPHAGGTFSQSFTPVRPFSPGGNHSALTERNSGKASQRSAIAARPG